MTTPSKAAPPNGKKVRLNRLDTANVTLYVRRFRDVFAKDPPVTRKVSPGEPPPHFDRGTLHRMWMPKQRHPQVYIKSNQPDTLHIKSKGATIRLTVRPARYYPVGIAFKLLKGVPNPNAHARIGFLNFEQSRTPRDPQSLFITDHFKDKGSDDQYKFSVIIQRVSDGAIGIIDPPIIHEP
jgi:hypothetical protein